MQSFNKEIEIQKLYARPYSYICQYMEDRLPRVGRKVYSVVCLMPVSMILPDFTYMGGKVRTNINVLLIGAPAIGKSTLCEEFEQITYDPIKGKSYTARGLEDEIISRKEFSLIVEDFSQMVRDPVLIKIIEGIIGEEKNIQRKTARTDIDIHTNGVGFFCGTLQDISSYLSGGFIFRTVPIIVTHNNQSHAEVGKIIIKNIGKEEENNTAVEKQEIIKEFYKELEMIQAGKHPKITPVFRCNFEEQKMEEAYNLWKDRTEKANAGLRSQWNWFRELQEFARFLFAHTFLNIHNRKVINGTIYPEKEDYEIAMQLMTRGIRVKYDVLGLSAFSRSIKDMRELQKRMEEAKDMTPERKELLKAIYLSEKTKNKAK